MKHIFEYLFSKKSDLDKIKSNAPQLFITDYENSREVTKNTDAWRRLISSIIPGVKKEYCMWEPVNTADYYHRNPGNTSSISITVPIKDITKSNPERNKNKFITEILDFINTNCYGQSSKGWNNILLNIIRKGTIRQIMNSRDQYHATIDLPMSHRAFVLDNIYEIMDSIKGQFTRTRPDDLRQMKSIQFSLIVEKIYGIYVYSFYVKTIC